jgi:hypothetical protein
MCSRVELKRGGGMCSTKAPRSTSFALSWLLARRRPRRGKPTARRKKKRCGKSLQPINRSLVLFVMHVYAALWGVRGPN